MIYRLILAKWAYADGKPEVIEKYDMDDAELLRLNDDGYNCYYLPNDTTDLVTNRPVDGADINCFNFVFADLDMKDFQSPDPKRRHEYPTKEAFLARLNDFPLQPTFVVDSGGGIHAYWQITDLDGISFLRFQRRLSKLLSTDPAVAKIYQLMRVPGTNNVKLEGQPRPCHVLAQTGNSYTSEDLHKVLPPISPEDEQYCQDHFNKTYNPELYAAKAASLEVPAKFHKILKESDEVNRLFRGIGVKDRSQADYRLGHLLRAHGLTADEARAVLMNTSKASERSPTHRYGYADNIVQKIWTMESLEEEAKVKKELRVNSVRDILGKKESIDAPRFPCFKHFDGTDHGFRLTEVLGLIGGSGAGKTTVALNFFGGFVIENMGKDYVHLFVSLEQPKEEIASRWLKFANDDALMQDSVYILDNFTDDGQYRDLGLMDIMEHVLALEEGTGKKVGCVTIDHIGVLRHDSKFGEVEGLKEICKQMKTFATATNTFLIMQSQTSREKAGIGDIELDKDAAYGTTKFEWYCDYIVTTWQPLKRIYPEKPHMTITAYKFCKIRKQNVLKDTIKVDEPRALMYEPNTERLRELTETEALQFKMCQTQVINIRKRDRRTEPAPIKLLTKQPEKKPNAAS